MKNLIPFLLIFIILVSCKKEGSPLDYHKAPQVNVNVPAEMSVPAGEDINFTFTGSQSEDCPLEGMQIHRQYKHWFSDTIIYNTQTVMRLDSIGVHYIRICIFDCVGWQDCRWFEITVYEPLK